MTIFKPKANKIKISLTNIEVLSCFGSYERLFTMSKPIKEAIKALLFDIALKEDIINFKKVKIDVKAKKNMGCVIIVNLYKKELKKYYIFDFLNSENLTKAVLLLYKNRATKNINSTLYKMPNFFRLIIYSEFKPNFTLLNEFCFRKSENLFEKAYSEEYGKVLIENFAIRTYAQFFKDF